MANKPNAEDIFCTFTGQNGAGRPFVRQKFMLPFWHSTPHLRLHIEPRAHTTECPILRGELMLAMARGCVVDLPLSSIVWAAWIVWTRKRRHLFVPSVGPLEPFRGVT
ncbi:hypothetical protein CJ030_MR0G007806 [Morella rubra]|uniref:Uncharacterized protein n=1 Tax=Morella rubra TaxID=262757 RepID=A0A6A1UKA5_9ROSI|nr:hypothetical protein CJ030_MR0G007806 [Morella rubra]